jgi:hypothetical protein
MSFITSKEKTQIALAAHYATHYVVVIDQDQDRCRIRIDVEINETVARSMRRWNDRESNCLIRWLNGGEIDWTIIEKSIGRLARWMIDWMEADRWIVRLDDRLDGWLIGWKPLDGLCSWTIDWMDQ